MLMKPDKKKLAGMIIGMNKPEMESVESKDGAEQDKSVGHKAAAEEILQAVESKDVSMLMEALKSFIEMCEHSEDEEPKQPEESKPE